MQNHVSQLAILRSGTESRDEHRRTPNRLQTITNIARCGLSRRFLTGRHDVPHAQTISHRRHTSITDSMRHTAERCGQKKGRPTNPEGIIGRPTRELPGVRGFLPLFFFLTPPGLLRRGRAVRSSGFHPQAARPRPQGSLVRALRSGRVADRPFVLHTEAPFRCG